jgi:hypothetical protein
MQERTVGPVREQPNRVAALDQFARQRVTVAFGPADDRLRDELQNSQPESSMAELPEARSN